jgi:hypothetical protein
MLKMNHWIIRPDTITQMGWILERCHTMDDVQCNTDVIFFLSSQFIYNLYKYIQ